MKISDLRNYEKKGHAILLNSVKVIPGANWTMELWEIQDESGNIDKYIKTVSDTIILQSEFQNKLYA